MAAENTDKFLKLARKWTAKIGAAGVADDEVTTIPLSSVTNLPTDTAVIVTIDRVDASGTATPTLEEAVIGVVSGTNLVDCVRGVEGTAQAHAAGASVEVLVTAASWNSMIDGFLAEHSQSGAHGSGLVTSIKASAATINTGTSDTSVVTPKGLADSNYVFTTKTQTLTNKTLTSPVVNKPTINGSVQAYTSNSDGATVTFNMAASNIHTVTLGGNRTLAVSNVSAGQCFIINLKQDGTGSRTVTWFSGISWAGGSAPTLTTTASKTDTLGFICTSVGAYLGYVVGQNL
jgi:hypothetical protein